MCYTSWCCATVKGQRVCSQSSNWHIIFVGITSKEQSRIFPYMVGTNDYINRPNGSIIFILTIMRNVNSSSAEAGCGALSYNARELESLRKALIYMVHPQQATEIITDNSTADGIMRGTIKQKRTKSIDIRFYWVLDWVEQKHFEVKWKPGHMNLGD